MPALGGGCTHRRGFARSPAAQFLLCGPAPDGPWTRTCLCPGAGDPCCNLIHNLLLPRSL